MKKIFLSIAIAALATLGFTSCGNAESTGEGTDTTAVEQAEQVNEEEIPIDSLKELQNDHYLIKIPEGCKANSRMVNNSCAMGFKESPFTSCSANFQTGTIDEFKKTELRVAEVVAAERVPKTDKLMKLTLSLGEETREVVSGIADVYTAEELVGKHVILVANLKPAKLRGIVSHGMVLAASDGEKLQLIETDMPAGSVVR